MPGEANPEAIKKLEVELREALAAQNFTEALDLLDEIEGIAPLRAPHLTAKGQCLIKLRRKQDAKAFLMQAFELDPSMSAATTLLDEFFPGWTRQPKTPSRPASAGAGSGMGMQGTGMGMPGGGVGASPQMDSPSSSAHQSAPRYTPTPIPTTTLRTGPATAGGVGGGYGAPVYVQGGVQMAPHTQEAPVNWKYVIEDLEMSRRQAPAAAAMS